MNIIIIRIGKNRRIYYDLQNIYDDKVSTKHVEPKYLVSFLNKEIQNGLSSSNTNVTIQDGSIVEIMRMFED